jgi:putative pyruvate formate lyase activating enzyme
MTQVWATRERLEQARQHYRRCRLCEHACGSDRTGPHTGPCKAGAVPRVFRHRVEYGDEREIVPSLLVYLSGCDLRCAFCINELNAFDPSRGRPLTPEFLREVVADGIRRGARTLQWVGGEPTIHLPAVLEAMAECPRLPRVVWKTDLFGTPEALDLLDGVADVYLADYKFGNDDCARRIAGVERYTEVLRRNLLRVARQGDLIVRHLLLPGHLDCCVKPIAAWLRENLPGVKFSLRDGYLPHWQAARHGELARPLARAEADTARAHAGRVGLQLVS